MYWIYLIIFTFIVFMPTIIQHGFFGFNTTQTQEFATLFLGSLGFLIFTIQEKRLKKNMEEKSDIQRKVNSMRKDLTHSYSYIGEVNRKVDILESIALSYPESLVITAKKQKEVYKSIMEAVRLFGKSDEFILRFVCLSSKEVLKEIKSFPGASINFSLKNLDLENIFFESDNLVVVNSPKSIDGVFSYIILKKKIPNQRIEDLEMIRTLAAQALFFFMFVRKENGNGNNSKKSCAARIR